MKLSDVSLATVEEARLAFDSVPIMEEGEGPRWKFDYSRFTKDPHPDILLLGAYQHPNTGNNLVGGVNLNYLTDRQRDILAKHLPQIMHGENLRARYRIGKKLAPDVFGNSYRTYNSRYIRGVNTDVMYPKYGLMKTTKQWLKKKLSNAFKTQAQRQKAAEPKYPKDLENMRDRLDQVVQHLQQEPAVKAEPTAAEPREITAARDAYKQSQKEKTLPDIKRREDLPLRKAQHDAVEPDQDEQIDPKKAQKELRQQREKNRKELLNPDNDINLDPIQEPEPDEEKPALENYIAYYSPIVGHTIFEPFNNMVHDSRPIIFSEGWGNKQNLKGEYWLSDGSSMYAENDHDHSQLAIDAARDLVADHLELDFDIDDDWYEFRATLCEQYPQLATQITMTWSSPRPELEAMLQQYGISMELWDIANWISDADPRLYAAQHWGWVRNESNNLEAFEISRPKLKEIAEGLYDAYPDDELETQSFNLFIYNSKVFYRAVPFDVIESGDMAALRDYRGN